MVKFVLSIFRAMRRLVPIVVSIALLVLLIAWMSGTFRDKIPPGEALYQARSVGGLATARVESLSTTESVDAVGTVQPRRKSDVASKLLATVQEVTVNPGDTVREGQLLVRLDDREIQAQLRELEAARLGVESDLSVRERDFERYKKMYSEKVVTKEEYDRVEGVYLVAQAQLKQTDEQMNRMRVTLSYTQILAPAAGIVADRYTDPGDLAAPGKPLLALHDPKELELHANVRESLSSLVALEQTLPVHIEALGRDLQGTVREIVPQAEAASRSVLVKVSLPSDRLDGLYIGMFGRLSIPVGEIQRVVVNDTAVQRVGQLELVDVVSDGDVLARRFVRTGRRFGDKIEILSGLNVGETVAHQ